MADRSTHATDSPASSAEHIENKETFDQLLTDEERVLVDFYADWCGPCQLMAPTVDELAAESEAAIVKVDIEALSQIAARYDVSSIPTFLAFEDGTVEEQLIGMQEKERLAQTVE
jgi:thioredoxin 1